MNVYEATIRLPGGGLEKVQVRASSWSNAKQLVEMQYGAGSVMNLVRK